MDKPLMYALEYFDCKNPMKFYTTDSNDDEHSFYFKDDFWWLDGLPIVILDDTYFITGYEKPKRVRTHHKKRIDKKWKKRFGYELKPIYNFHNAWVIDHKIYMSRVTFEELKEQIKEQ